MALKQFIRNQRLIFVIAGYVLFEFLDKLKQKRTVDYAFLKSFVGPIFVCLGIEFCLQAFYPNGD